MHTHLMNANMQFVPLSQELVPSSHMFLYRVKETSVYSINLRVLTVYVFMEEHLVHLGLHSNL